MKPKRGGFKRSFQNKPRSQNWRPQEYRHGDQLVQEDVGITEYLSSKDGFSGVIKARYSDFQLNEIDLEGNIAKLTNTDIPKDFSLKMVKQSYTEVAESPNKHIPQDIWESLKKVVDNSEPEPVILNVENLEKSERKDIHECIKSHFGRKLIVSTVEQDGKKVLKFEKFAKGTVDARFQWPEHIGDYIHFIVYKEKMDTLEAIFKISSAIGIGPSQFQHAGNKDRRAITSQWFSAKRIEPWKLIIKTKQLYNIKIGNIKFKNAPLKLGKLKGNRFRIALRNVTASDEVILEALNNLKQNHFINYYGLQRFGNDKEVPTYKVGISLLQGKWKEAVDLILKPKSSDDPSSSHSDIVQAKKIYAETGNASKAFAALQKNKSKCVEGKLLEGLKNNNENDYINALEKIPRQMRLLYIHAFQSLIWNKMVSKRLQLFGTKPVVGDLVFLSNCEDTQEDEIEELNESTPNTSQNEKDIEAKQRARVKALQESDLGIYSLFDIVLPLPGYDVTYPEHMKPYYKESVEELGLTLEMTQQTVKSYTLSGSYRKILGKVEDLSWNIVKYNKPTDNLILSDLQELKKNAKLQTDDNGQYKAVILEFALASCSYATMVLREVMKVDTSTNAQSKLNNYHSEAASKVEKPPEEEEEDVSMAPSSLLSDPEKFESFKNAVFNVTTEKRAASEENGESSKRQKLDDTDK
ncbi:unnamed protein product [Phyllotreta striolata]|uniref:TRUD domain-containing protein n=1 Tax=Phyllotreta striolata TaxID=444603 RepID=A0A9N9T9T3_PHYSR|nr:unnamed protein product [Phyllotreta striolata]